MELNPTCKLPNFTFTLTDEQFKAAKNIVEWLKEFKRTRGNGTSRYYRLSGYAGTGKTALISYLLSDENYRIINNHSGLSVAVCAFTWRAALVLRSKGVGIATSIHSVFYEPYIDEHGVTQHQKISREKIIFMYSLIIVDEASMVGEKMRKDLESYGVPILYVGDPAQLPPIGDKDGDFMKRAESMLVNIHRQALESPIIQLSLDIRNGKNVESYKFSDIIENKELFCNNDIQVIVGKNDTRISINKFVRSYKGIDHEMMPTKGEKIIGRNNLLKRGVYNGQDWIVGSDYSKNLLQDCVRTPMELLAADGSSTYLKTLFPYGMMNGLKAKPFVDYQPDKLYKELQSNEIYQADFGYAITAHVSQGSAYKGVIVIKERMGGSQDDHRRWLYTAVTRAEEMVFIVTGFDQKMLYSAIK